MTPSCPLSGFQNWPPNQPLWKFGFWITSVTPVLPRDSSLEFIITKFSFPWMSCCRIGPPAWPT